MRKRKYSNIPERTEILGRKIVVKYNTPRVIEKGLYGSMNCVTGELHLSEEIYGNKVPVEEMEITYWHEILHYIFNKNGYEKTFNDKGIDLEKIVEDTAVGIQQAITKAK